MPWVVVSLTPASAALTNSFKPATQILSHLAQLGVIYSKKSTMGVSLTSQHANWVGAWAGLYMCYFIPPKAASTYFLYVNSVFQAASFYFAVVWYDGTRAFLRSSGLTSWMLGKRST